MTVSNSQSKYDTLRISPSEIDDSFVIVDVRTPKEFEEFQIPGAISVPLFENLEHHEIGILYKNVSQEKAIEKGKEFVYGKLERMMEGLMRHKHSKILVYCARGGMRSRSVSRLLRSLQFDAYVLDGGMKSYRNFIISELESFPYPPLVVIQGLAGNGKTRLINRFENSIDLEGLAGHRSSLFGSMGTSPRSQKMFMFLLYERLKQVKDCEKVFIEGENRKIGDIIIPEPLWLKMESSPTIMIGSSLEKRTKNILEDYPLCSKNQEKYLEILDKLRPFLSHKVVDDLIAYFKEGHYGKVVKILLRDYYDHKYKHFILRHKIRKFIFSDDEEFMFKLLNTLIF